LGFSALALMCCLAASDFVQLNDDESRGKKFVIGTG